MELHSATPTGEEGNTCAACGATVAKGGIVSEDGRLYCTQCDVAKQPVGQVAKTTCCHCGGRIHIQLEAPGSPPKA